MSKPKRKPRLRAKRQTKRPSRPRPHHVWQGLRSFRAVYVSLGRRMEAFEEALRDLREAIHRETLRKLMTVLACSDAGEVLNELDRIRSGSAKGTEEQDRALRTAREAIEGLFEVLSKEAGLAPVAKVGERVSLTPAHLDQYEIVGEGFEMGRERIEATVMAPGWRLGSVVLQRPRVRSEKTRTSE